MHFFIRGIATLSSEFRVQASACPFALLAPLRRQQLKLRPGTSVIGTSLIIERACGPGSRRWNSQLMTAAASGRPLLGCSMARDTTIVKRPLSHHFVKISVLWISWIAVLAMMAHVALIQLRNAPGAH